MPPSQPNNQPVAILGLGIMGSAMARNLLDAGFAVRGFDPNPEAGRKCSEMGVAVAPTALEAVQACTVILTSLPSESALSETVSSLVMEPQSLQDDAVVVELSTLSLEAKQSAHDTLTAAGIVMLDCPVSGTGAQAVTKDIVLYASGDEQTVSRCQSVFNAIARQCFFLGDFGNGMRMKLIANLLVAVHNVATAEAFQLAKHAGLDLQAVYDVISSGAGSSKIFELRGPMMVEDTFEPATMKLDVWQKDMTLIEDFAKAVGAETALFDATQPLYEAANKLGLGKMDTAAVYRVLGTADEES